MNAEFLQIANNLGLYTREQIQDVPNEYDDKYRVLRVNLRHVATAIQLEQTLIELQQSDEGYYFADDYDLGVFLEAHEHFDQQLMNEMDKHPTLKSNKDALITFLADYEMLIEIK